MKDFVYFPNVTLDCVKHYAKRSIAMKGYQEGLNLRLANHVNSVEFFDFLLI